MEGFDDAYVESLASCRLNGVSSISNFGYCRPRPSSLQTKPFLFAGCDNPLQHNV
jgi:hypothetical protein